MKKRTYISLQNPRNANWESRNYIDLTSASSKKKKEVKDSVLLEKPILAKKVKENLFLYSDTLQINDDFFVSIQFLADSEMKKVQGGIVNNYFSCPDEPEEIFYPFGYAYYKKHLLEEIKIDLLLKKTEQQKMKQF